MVLMYLTRTPQRLTTIAEIVRTYDIPHNQLMKIVSDLRKAGFVEAVRGRNGGIRLARPAREITLGEVVRHTEAGRAPTENDSSASRGSNPLADTIGRAFGTFLAKLDDHTFDEVAQEDLAPRGN